MAAKLMLDMVAMEENFFSDTALIGIVSALSPHRFCQQLNRKMALDFVRRPENDPMIKVGGESHYFHFFEYCLPLNGGRYMVYKLKSGKQVLLPEVKQLDYLWMVECGAANEEAAGIMQLLRNLPDVQLAQIIAADKLKNSGHLLI